MQQLSLVYFGMPKTISSIIIVASLLTFIGCSYRYTKAYRQEKSTESQQSRFVLSESLDSRLGLWDVSVLLSSVNNSKDKRAFEADMYHLIVSFVVPPDSTIAKFDSDGNYTFDYLHYYLDAEDDTTLGLVHLDSLSILKEPVGELLYLAPSERRSDIRQRVSFRFDSLYLPPTVDSIKLDFAAFVRDASGTETTRQRFSQWLYRYDYKWNDWLPLE